MTELASLPVWRRFAPLLVLLLVLAAVVALRLDRYLAIDVLSGRRAALDAFVARNFLVALALYVAVYVTAIAISAPLSIFLSLAGGYLFGVWLGGAAAWLSGVAGATLIFLAARTALGDALRKRAGRWLTRFQAGFRDNAFNYLLALRLTPIIPFWIVNLAPACFNVKPRDFVVATLIGHAPVTFVIASVGAALHEALVAGSALDAGATLNQLLFSPLVIGAICGLVALALAPVIIKALRKSRGA